MKTIFLKWQQLNKKHDLFSYFLYIYFFAYLPIVSLTTFIAIPSIVIKFLLIISIVILIFAFLDIAKKIAFVDFVVVGAFFAFSLFSFVIFQNNRSNIVAGLKIFFTSLWFYYLIFRFCQENQKRIGIVSFGSVVNIFVLFIVSIIHLKRKQTENMTLCYETLFFTSLCLSYGFSQQRINYKAIIFSLAVFLGIITIYLFGSRGPLLFAALLIIIYIYLKIKSKRIKMIYLSTFIFIVAVGFVVPLICILTYSSGNKLAIKILDFYAKIFTLSGREYLYLIEMNGFAYSPIVGHGLFGDRFLSIGFIYSNPKTIDFSFIIQQPNTTYAHNIIIELLVSIGAPLTILLIVGFFAFFFNYIHRVINDKNNTNIFLLPLMITGLCSLLLSNSFAVSNYFWGFLGSCVFLFVNNDCSRIKKAKKPFSTNQQHFEMDI